MSASRRGISTHVAGSDVESPPPPAARRVITGSPGSPGWKQAPDLESPEALESPSSIGLLRASLAAQPSEGKVLELLIQGGGFDRLVDAIDSETALVATALDVVAACTERFPITCVEFCRRVGKRAVELAARNDVVGCNACAVLANLAFVDINCEHLAALGVLPVAVDALRRGASAHALAVQSARLVRNLAAHPTLQAKLYALGAHDALGAVMAAFPDVEVSVEAVCAVANLAEDDACVDGLMTLAPAVVKAMGSHDSAVLRAGSAALANLAVHDGNATLLLKQGAAQVLLAALRAYPSDVELARAACEALAYLADEAPADLMKMQAGAAVLDVLTRHTEDAAVCEEACGLVTALAVDSVSRAALAQTGVGPAVLTAMRTHAGDVDVVEEACYALCELCKDASAVAAVKDVEAELAVVRLLAPEAADQLLGQLQVAS